MMINRAKWTHYKGILGIVVLLAILHRILNFHQPIIASPLNAGAPPVLGEEYTIITHSGIVPKASPEDTVSVIEFFSYSCSACYDIESAVQAWLNLQPSFVKFEQIPVNENDTSSHHIVRLHYLGHRLKKNMTTILFQWLNKGQDLKNTLIVKQNFLDLGISSADYEQAIRGQAGLDAQIARGKNLEKIYEIEEMPLFIIGGRYKTSLSMTKGDLFRFFEVMNALIEKIKQGE
jgi:thiol:disulfide interchange protein DsbA